MRDGLHTSIVLVAVFGGGLSCFLVLSQLDNPDLSVWILGGIWLAFPHLTAALAARMLLRYRGATVTLLVSLIVATVAGLWFYSATATAHVKSRQEDTTAVRPGEDPDHGPAGMRKTGADVGAVITGVFSILVAVVIPPVQFFGILVPTLIGFACSKRAGPADRRDSSPPD